MGAELLIGLAGKARSGKDTVAGVLYEEFGFHRYAFADPLKEACSIMFNVPLHYFYDEELKEEVIPEWEFSPRQMAQLLGTEGGRNLFSKDIWIVRAQSEWNQCTKPMVVSDVRFENEADWVRSEGGTIWHLRREGAARVTSHDSEAGIWVRAGDRLIDNNSTIESLKEKARELCRAESGH